jgi:hypothetical protein
MSVLNGHSLHRSTTTFPLAHELCETFERTLEQLMHSYNLEDETMKTFRDNLTERLTPRSSGIPSNGLLKTNPAQFPTRCPALSEARSSLRCQVVSYVASSSMLPSFSRKFVEIQGVRAITSAKLSEMLFGPPRDL